MAVAEGPNCTKDRQKPNSSLSGRIMGVLSVHQSNVSLLEYVRWSTAKALLPYVVNTGTSE